MTVTGAPFEAAPARPGSGPGPSARPLDQIRLGGLTARGRHGVFAHERRDGQDFVVDVVLHLDTAAAAATDDLSRTVDYGALAVRVAEVVRGEPVDLIEALADRIARRCIDAPDCAGVAVVEVTVHKPSAPIPEPFADVAVVIRRSRAELLDGPEPPRAAAVAAAPAGERRSLDRRVLDRKPETPVTAVLALGTNLGDGPALLRAAVAGLQAVPGLTVDTVSPVVETDPVGGPEQPDYLNAVVLVTTELSPRELLAACLRIESGQGRARTVRWGPRTLDVDVIRYGDLLSADPVLELPHPRAEQRAFVLAPWLAADQQAWLPGPDGRRPVAPLLAGAPDRAGVRPRPDLLVDPLDRSGPLDGTDPLDRP